LRTIRRSTSAAHRALHPFPTRRSSDLAGGDQKNDRERHFRHHKGGMQTVRAGGHRSRSGAQNLFYFANRRAPSRRQAAKKAGQRSEEHTSELQSPYDLVCRLLLEKKTT